MRFRLRPEHPGRLWAALVIFAVLFAAVPALIVRAIPASQLTAGKSETVELGTPITGWIQPVGSLTCEVNPESIMGNGYFCNGGNITSLVVSDVADLDIALQRLVRSESYQPTIDGIMPYQQLNEGTPLVEGFPHSGHLAIGIPGGQEHPDLTMVVILSGPQLVALTSAVWQGLFDEPLPNPIAATAQTVQDQYPSFSSQFLQFGQEGTKL